LRFAFAFLTGLCKQYGEFFSFVSIFQKWLVSIKVQKIEKKMIGLY